MILADDIFQPLGTEAISQRARRALVEPCRLE
jgi:hypothetical protein